MAAHSTTLTTTRVTNASTIRPDRVFADLQIIHSMAPRESLQNPIAQADEGRFFLP